MNRHRRVRATDHPLHRTCCVYLQFWGAPERAFVPTDKGILGNAPLYRLSPHPFHSFILSYWLTSKSLSEARMNSKDWLRAYVSRPQVSKMFTPRLMSLREKLYYGVNATQTGRLLLLLSFTPFPHELDSPLTSLDVRYRLGFDL